MKKSHGFDLLNKQLLDRVSADICGFSEFAETNASCGDTPIERLFSCALWLSVRHLEQAWFTDINFVGSGETEKAKQECKLPDIAMIVERQAQLEGWRVDFLVTVYGSPYRRDGGVEGWDQLIVECDGHDFHERTKEQATKDRSRDRKFQLAGIDVFRFTGSELWRDPLSCADQVIAWADKRVG